MRIPGIGQVGSTARTYSANRRPFGLALRIGRPPAAAGRTVSRGAVPAAVGSTDRAFDNEEDTRLAGLAERVQAALEKP